MRIHTISTHATSKQFKQTIHDFRRIIPPETCQISGKRAAMSRVVNLLITIEAAMSGGLIFQGRDGCFRDLASIHGTYRKVEETIPAIKLIGEFLTEIRIASALWLLDSPVSNSGRLKTLIGQLARANHWPWEIRLTISPDAELSSRLTVPSSQFPANRPLPAIVVSTDSVILDACQKWTNLAAAIIKHRLPSTTVIDLA